MAGSFFGGIAEGMLAKRELGLRERALGLEQEATRNEQQRFLIGEADKAISGTLDLIGKTITGVKDSTALSGGLPEYREAIASIEQDSRGYQTIGPTTEKGDNAYGRYGIMGANIPSWTQEVLGRPMSPQEFLASTEAQDAVFDAKFGQFIQESGSVEDAASIWLTGRKLSEGGAGAEDMLGTSGTEYVQKFTQSLVGIPKKKMASAVEPLLRDVEELAQKTGRDPGRYRRQVEAMITATPTGAQIAINEGEAAAAKKLAEATGLIRAGIGRADALVSAGLKTAKEGENADGSLDAETALKVEEGLRKEYSGLSKDFVTVRDAYERMGTAYANPTPETGAADMALIFGFMKMLDPTSVVRETEYANAQNAAGVPDRVRNLYNQVLSGARLTEKQRQDFFGQAQHIYKGAAKNNQVLKDQFGRIALKAGVDPENVLLEFGTESTATAPATDGDGWSDLGDGVRIRELP